MTGFGTSNRFVSQGQGPFQRPVMQTLKLVSAPVLAAKEPKTENQAPAVTQDSSQQKLANLVDRLCSILTKFSEKQVNEEVAGRIFWSYADDARIPPELVAKMISERCPGLKVPAKPVIPKSALKNPEKEGFHGKTEISYEEARELSGLLAVVLAPLTPEEAASEIADKECLGELNDAGGFPLVERLQERLRKFLDTSGPEAVFTISHGETVVTGKAVECAEALGRVKVVKTVVTVGGVAVGGGAALWLLLGLL